MWSRVQLSFWTLYLWGSQPSDCCSTAFSCIFMLNSSQASLNLKQRYIIRSFFATANDLYSFVFLLKTTNLKSSASPGRESFVLPIQFVALACGRQTFGPQLRKLVIHSMGEGTELWVDTWAQAKHTVPVVRRESQDFCSTGAYWQITIKNNVSARLQTWYWFSGFAS